MTAHSVTTLYRYGAIAWVWRLMIAVALLGGGGAVLLGLQLAAPALVLFGLVLVAPALFFGAVLVVQVDRRADASLEVKTLIFWRRRIEGARLGAPRVRQNAQNDWGPIYAPRVWIPVRGALPLYIDLLGTITERRTFGATFGLSGAQLPATSAS